MRSKLFQRQKRHVHKPFCFGFDISEDIKKWDRKVRGLENGVTELANYPGKGKKRSFRRRQHSLV